MFRKRVVLILLLAILTAASGIGWSYWRWKAYDAALRALREHVINALDDYYHTNKQFPVSLASINLAPLPGGATTDMLAHVEYVCAPDPVSRDSYSLKVRRPAFGFWAGEINQLSGRSISH